MMTLKYLELCNQRGGDEENCYFKNTKIREKV